MPPTENDLTIRIRVAKTRASAALNSIRNSLISFTAQTKKSNSIFKANTIHMLAMAAAYLAFRSALRFVIREGKDIILFTANVDLLRVSMEQLARVNNINIKFLEATTTVMRSMGVATDDAMKTIVAFIRLNLDLTKVLKFTRVAQDLAVVSQKTTSKVVEQLTRGVTTLNARMLRSAGVFFTAKQAAKEWADANDRTVASMSVAEKQTAVLNKIIEDGTKIAGAYEASLSFAGKKVLQLNRLWKEAKLALGSFTQDALLVGVESLQNFLKSIVNLRENGRLDEFGKSLSRTLINITNIVKNISKAILNSAKIMFRWRSEILLIAEAFIAWKVIAIVIRNVVALNAAMVTLTGTAFIPWIAFIQSATLDLGLLGTATLSVASALTILGTAIIGVGIGKFIGDILVVSDVMRNFRDKVRTAFLPDALKEFIDEWVFGALLIQDLEKQTTKLLADNIQKRIALRLKEARKVQEELAKEEQIRRRVNQAQVDFGRTLDSIAKVRDDDLTKTEKNIRKLKELKNALLVNMEVLKSFQSSELIFEASFDMKMIASDIDFLNQKIEEQTTQWGRWGLGVKNALKRVDKEVDAFAGKVFTTLGDGFSNAFHEMAIGTKTAEDAFRDFARNFIIELNRMSTRLLVFIALKETAGLISGASGGEGGGEGGGGADTIPAKGAPPTTGSQPSNLARGNISSFQPIMKMGTGNVFNRPTLGLVAETSAARPEIVSPVGLMKQTMKSAIREEGAGGKGGGDTVIVIQALDSKSFEQYVRRNPKPILDLVGNNIKRAGALRTINRNFK